MKLAVLEFPPRKKARNLRKNPPGGVKICRSPTWGGLKPHPFETTGEYRLHVNGVPGPWVKGPAERGDAERTY